MPFKTCSSGGKTGVKYGDSGKCYTGKGARAKAGKQATAIKASQASQVSKAKKDKK